MLMNINEIDSNDWISHCAKRNKIHGIRSIRVDKSLQSDAFLWSAWRLYGLQSYIGIVWITKFILV